MQSTGTIIIHHTQNKIIKMASRISITKERDSTIYRNSWFEFSTGFHLPCFKVGPAGYFDKRAQIVLSLGWGLLFLHLPIYSEIEECEYPQYGFYLYNDGRGFFTSLWLCLGYKVKCIHMPWEYDWVRTSNLRVDGKWEHETKGNRKEFYDDKWKGVIKHETYPFVYKCKDGTIQDDINATIKTTEMEWRPRWFKWTGLFKKVRKSIEIKFDKEVGEERGSWKGGVTGCGYDMNGNETPLDTLRRMAMERSFAR